MTIKFPPSTYATTSLQCIPPYKMSDERRTRSRFDDDGEPERPARSRFDSDRRSRSPSTREPEAHRERSPVARDATDSPSTADRARDKAAAAAAAAARINAQIQAKKGIQHIEVPPIRSVRTSQPRIPTLLTTCARRQLLQYPSPPAAVPVRLSLATRTSRTATLSKTLKSMISVIVIH